MISLPNEPPRLRQLSHLRNISWFGLLPPWQAVTCGSTEAQQQFGRLPSDDSAHSFVPLFLSLPSFSSSSANTKFYMHFVKSFFQGNANSTEGKGLAFMEPTAVGMTESSQDFPKLASPLQAGTRALTPHLHPTHGNRGSVSCLLEQVK